MNQDGEWPGPREIGIGAVRGAGRQRSATGGDKRQGGPQQGVCKSGRSGKSLASSLPVVNLRQLQNQTLGFCLPMPVDVWVWVQLPEFFGLPSGAESESTARDQHQR